MPNMFDMDGWEKVTYCKECKRSYTPITVKEDKPVVTARFCGLTNRIKRDDGFCDEGVVMDD